MKKRTKEVIKGWLIWLVGIHVLALGPMMLEAIWPHNGAAFAEVIILLWFMVLNHKYHLV